RRTLIELMHADLISIRAGLAQLESAGVRIMDCHHVGLSASEPIAKIRTLADEWKQPFQKAYTERTVNQAFDKLLGLRTDVERAMERLSAKTAESSAPAPAVPSQKPAQPLKAPEPPPRRPKNQPPPETKGQSKPQ